MEPNPLRKFEERLAQCLPATALAIPVVLAQVGTDPDFGAPGFVGLDIIMGRLQHGRNVAGRAGRFACRRIEQALGRLDLEGLIGRAVDEHPARRAQHLERLHQLSPPRFELCATCAPAGLLHAGRAIEQNDRRVGATPCREAQPSAG